MKNIEIDKKLSKSRRAAYVFFTMLMSVSLIWIFYDIRIAFSQLSFVGLSYSYFLISRSKFDKTLSELIEKSKRNS